MLQEVAVVAVEAENEVEEGARDRALEEAKGVVIAVAAVVATVAAAVLLLLLLGG
jgi:hypothetical protein